MKRTTALFAATLALMPVVAFAQATDKPAEAQSQDAYIPFADKNGVRDWQAEGTDAVYFQDAQKRWYRADLMMPATDLPFALHIGIDSGATGRLDKWGAIVVNGQRYPFTSFVRVAGPPEKAKKGERTHEHSK